MALKELKPRPDIASDKKLGSAYAQFAKLLAELRQRELPEEVVTVVNAGIDRVNSVAESGKALRKQIRKTQSSILQLLEKELNLVTKNHYRNTWMALGMAVFGIPLGVSFGVAIDNMAFIGLGLPIGIGTEMDKKALAAGRQIDLEVEY